MYKVRRRLINFRVTDDEFQQLKAAAALQGCRCLSEFARGVMLGSTGAQFGAAPVQLDSQMVMFDRRLSVLESNVARLVDLLGSSASMPVPANVASVG